MSARFAILPFIFALLDALEAYERKQLDDPSSLEAKLGRSRCLKALGEWERLNHLAVDLWIKPLPSHVKSQVAYAAASAALNLRKWDFMYDSTLEYHFILLRMPFYM